MCERRLPRFIETIRETAPDTARCNGSMRLLATIEAPHILRKSVRQTAVCANPIAQLGDAAHAIFSIERADAAAAQLSDGSIVVVGGSSNGALNTIERCARHHSPSR
jgi:hypothetical protein